MIPVKAALAAVATALLIGGAVGWAAHHQPPAPAMHLDQQAAKVEQATSATDTKVTAGPVDVVTVTEEFEPEKATAPEGAVGMIAGTTPNKPSEGPTVPAEPILVKRTTRTEHTGPVETDTHATASTSSASTLTTHLDVVPAPQPPGWELQLGIEDALGARAVRLAARRRLLGPIWVELAGVPVRREIGIAVAVAF